MNGAWIALEPGWLLLQAELLADGNVVTSTTPAIGRTGATPVTALVRREQTLVEVEIDGCGCAGRFAALLRPEVTAEQAAAAADSVVRRLADLGPERS